ncbi:hypothetical protein J1N35_000003 [Gossypium stocksii]|uniref:Uncharacterized protein n=1 Tax=Gossypium stocksii TaxID=47602 RepID=A0A9D4AI90_9ROSI|nr:hypothetical protein J1N35_000003 [Gossypium stocksii]
MLRSYLNRWNYVLSHVGLPNELQDIRLLLDQWLETEFEWKPYEDPVIRKVIFNKFFVNSNARHVKVLLVVYATVEIHETNRDPWQAISVQGIGEALTSPYELDSWTSIPDVLHTYAIYFLDDDDVDDDDTNDV